MIEIKATRNLVPGDRVIYHALELEVIQVIRGRKRSQINFSTKNCEYDDFTLTAHNTKEWTVVS